MAAAMEDLPPEMQEVIQAMQADGLDIDIHNPQHLMAVVQMMQEDGFEFGVNRRQETIPDKVLSSLDLSGVADWIKDGKAKRIIVMVGAGLSTAAGIPDFRTPGTGLYDNLQKYQLPRPEAIFTLSFFRQNPGAFYELARDMWPGNYSPTKAHYFIKLLENRGLLCRCYSQNIDSLEELAGVSPDLIVAAHGNFSSAHELDSGKEVPIEELRAAVLRGEEGWKEMRERRGHLVKPDIVFFGEGLPERFGNLVQEDFEKCDLLIVMGTSLVVQPFANCVTFPDRMCPRLLINREPAGTEGQLRGGFRIGDDKRNYRDAFYEGNCDAGVEALCEMLGWREDLERVATDGLAALKSGSSQPTVASGGRVVPSLGRFMAWLGSLRIWQALTRFLLRGRAWCA